MTSKEAIEIIRSVRDKLKCDEPLDLQIALTKAITALEEKADREKADGCTGCAYFNVELWKVPCKACRRNSMDFWRWPKE